MGTLAEQLSEARGRASELLALKRDLTEQELDEAEKLSRKAADLEAQIARHQRSQDTLRALQVVGSEPEQKAIATPGVQHEPASRGMADILLSSQAWKNFQALYPNGVPDSQRGVNIPAVSIPSKALLGTGAPQTKVMGDATSGVTNLTTPQYLFPPAEVQPVRPPLILRSLITTGTTQADTIYYARESSYSNQAAVVPEDGSATKPESTLAYTREQATVETVAHWISASKQALSDVGQLSTLIDNFLTWGINDSLEQQMLNGTGTGQFTGLLNLTGIQSVGPVTGDIAGIKAVREAITLVQKPGLAQPNAVLMSVEDDAAIDLAQDSMGRFFGNGPFSTGPNTLWGLPRVTSWNIPQGTALVGDFKRAVLWDREQASISVSDSHADFFIRNLVAILGELRAAFGVFRPQAFVKVTLA